MILPVNKNDSSGLTGSLNGHSGSEGKWRKHGEKPLDFALAALNAFRYKYSIRTPMSQREIVDWCKFILEECGFPTTGCTYQRIQQIENKALRKLRMKTDTPDMRELLEHHQYRGSTPGCYVIGLKSGIHGTDTTQAKETG